MPVVDASVIVASFAGGPGGPEAEAVVSGERGNLLAPHLVDAEVGHALRGLTTAGRMESRAAEESLRDLMELPITRAPHSLLLEDAWTMRSIVSFYDALYLALGRLLGTPVLTLDRRLSRAVSGLSIEVEVVG